MGVLKVNNDQTAADLVLSSQEVARNREEARQE